MVSSSSGSGKIAFSGLASGIDTSSIVSQLIALQRRPVYQIMDRVDGVQTKIDAYNALKTSMSALLTSAAPLKDAATFGQRSTTLGALTADVGKITASATNGAALQGFTFEAVALATATAAASATAMGAAIDAGVKLDAAGFGAAVVPGSFSINGHVFTIAAATPETYESGIGVGASFNAASKLVTANLDLVPTSGSFTVNGHSFNFDIDDDSLNDVIARINSADTGVQASYDSTTKMLKFTAEETGPSAITIADTGGGTFFQSMQMLDGGGGNVGTITAGTDLVSLNSIITDINSAGIGVTATLVNDALGRPNLLELTAGANVQVGSGGDTSNFLSLTSLLQSPPGTTRTSVKGLGQTQQSANLDEARLATALVGPTGSFKVNGVEITWDAAVDSIQNVITRINQSSANVTATYDAFSDEMHLTSDAMGSTSIQLEDVGGNFLAASGLLAATQTLGTNASYKINGGAVRYSASNTITDAVPGVTITMNDLPTSPIKIAVNLATSAVSTAVNAFVTQYNKTTGGMRDLVKYDPEKGNGILFGDATVQRLESQLRTTLTGAQSGMPAGLRTLSDIGISFGAVGAAVGTTSELVLDTAKFAAKLQSDPEAVAKLLTAFTANASMDAGGTGSIASISGTPTAATKTGRYTIASDTFGVLQATFQATDGSAPLVTTGSITAGGTNTTLIPGLTITAKPVLANGSDGITIGATQQGFGKAIHEYINALSRSGGLLATRADEMQTQISSMNRQIDTMEARITAKEAQLTKRFTAMEQAIARSQAQGTQLTNIMKQLSS